MDDFEIMTVGMCLDYIHEWVESQKPQKEKTRKASQVDYDAF